MTNNKRNTKRRQGVPRGPRVAGDSVGAYMGDAWSLAKRTAAGLNEIRKLINVEEKYAGTQNNTTYDRVGAVVFLSGIDQGDGTSQREGNSLKVQHFRLNLFIKHNTAVTGGVCSRIMVVRDLQNQGATITADDVLETINTSSAPLAHRDFINGPLQNKRFSVVYDKMFVTDPYNLIKCDMFDTNHDCHVYYRGTTNAVASAGNGSYFMIAVGSDSGANLPTVFYDARLEFTDN